MKNLILAKAKTEKPTLDKKNKTMESFQTVIYTIDYNNLETMIFYFDQ